MRKVIIILHLVAVAAGGCKQATPTTTMQTDGEKPMQLTKDTTNSWNDVMSVIRIDKSWNINGLVLGKSSEADFLNSGHTVNFERMVHAAFDSHQSVEMIYQNEGNGVSLIFSSSRQDIETPENNILKGYYISDFKLVETSFENDLKPGAKPKDVLKLYDKSHITNYESLQAMTNYVGLKSTPYTIDLMFDGYIADEKSMFSGIYVK